jgi:hypothetical protein
MISVVIPTLNDESVLGRALQPLVGATIEGLISEVIVVDAGSTDGTLQIADDAGCRIIEEALSSDNRWGAGESIARRDWILRLEPQAWLSPGWEAAARDHIERHPGRSAVFPGKAGGMLGWLGLGAPAPLARLAPIARLSKGGAPRRMPVPLASPGRRG